MNVRVLALVGMVSVACDSDGDAGDTDASTGGSTSTTSASATSATTQPDPSASETGAPQTSTSTTDAPTSAGTSSSGDGDGDSSSSSTGGAFGSPGCGTAPTLVDGENTFSLDGYDRRYVLRLPENYDPDQEWPLIFALHGNGGNPGYWDGIGGDRDIRTAFATEAILVIPEAINNAWRDYDADSSTWPMFMDLELAAFDEMLASVSNDLCVDQNNVFSMGFSGGGSFSGVLGCRRDYIRAIAVGGSVIYFEEADCTETAAAWITIGDGELTGGREAYRDFFRDHDGCEATSTPVTPQGCIAYDNCGPDTPVVFCSHPADHVWPSIGTDAARAFFQQFYAG